MEIRKEAREKVRITSGVVFPGAGRLAGYEPRPVRLLRSGYLCGSIDTDDPRLIRLCSTPCYCSTPFL